MKETLERVWSSNIGDYDAYWDDIYDVHGYWIDATENPEDAEYTLEELEQTKLKFPILLTGLFFIRNKVGQSKAFV